MPIRHTALNGECLSSIAFQYGFFVSTIFSTRLMRGVQPRANAQYTLIIDGQKFSGTTDGDGVIRQTISPDAKQGTLIVSEDGREERYTLMLGHLNPIEDTSGVKARRRNLGFFADEIDETADDALAGAIAAFQSRHGLQDSGEADEATRDNLVQESGGRDMRCSSWGPG